MCQIASFFFFQFFGGEHAPGPRYHCFRPLALAVGNLSLKSRNQHIPGHRSGAGGGTGGGGGLPINPKLFLDM